ncbi:hypothetical protein [Halalkalibacter hemicellulosilyticus]|uniref:Membrane protein n=1 Tax=Halalkalibacter hemicellulosilyticusJCM 9152 TaxID=1236971 RepID=W4QG90_9BACI|nr:membrane protein [Halalkalibacter hemicellulosilyticusJCM 9152]
MKKQSPIDQLKWWQRLRDHRYIRIILFMIVSIILYFLMVGNIIHDTLDVRLSEMADRDIRAPITVEHRSETDERRAEARDSIAPVYELKREYAENQVRKVHDIFDLITQVRNEEEEELEEEELEEDELPLSTEEELLEDRLVYIKEVLSPGTSNDLSDDTLLTFLQATDSQLQIARESTTNAVYEIMSESISTRDVSDAKREVENQIAISTVSNRLLDAMVEVAQFAIIPNYIYDADATQQLREEAAENVEPVLIREGELLVREGEMINHEVYEQLRLVGLLDDQVHFLPYIGLAMLVILMMAMLSYYLSQAKTSVQTNNSHLLMFIIIFLITVILMKVVSLLEVIEIIGLAYAVPVSLGAMLITLLIHTRIALFTSVMFAIMGSVFFNNDTVGTFNFTYGFYMLFSGFAGAYFLEKSNRVSRILRAGLFVSGINIVVVVTLLFLKSVQPSWIELGMHLGFAFLSGFVASVLTIGLLPFLEAGFGILSLHD